MTMEIQSKQFFAFLIIIVVIWSSNTLANEGLAQRFSNCISHPGISIDTNGWSQNETANISIFCNSKDFINQIVFSVTDTKNLELDNTSILSGNTFSIMYKDYVARESSNSNQPHNIVRDSDEFIGLNYYIVTGAGYAQFEKTNNYQDPVIFDDPYDVNGLFMIFGFGAEKMFQSGIVFGVELGLGVGGVINHDPVKLNFMYQF